MNPAAQHGFDIIFQSLSKLPPDELFAEAKEISDEFMRGRGKCAALRSSAVRQLRHDYTYEEIAAMFGVSAQRIQQLVDR